MQKLISTDQACQILAIDYGIPLADTNNVFYMITSDPNFAIGNDINSLECWEDVLEISSGLLDRVESSDNKPVMVTLPRVEKSIDRKIIAENSREYVEKRQVKPEDKKQYKKRLTDRKSRKTLKINTNKVLNTSVSENIPYLKYQENLATSGYLYNIDRRYALKITESLKIILLDKKIGTQTTIGSFVTLHPHYDVIPSEEYHSLPLLMAVNLQLFFAELSKIDCSQKMIDLRYWLQFKDCIEALKILNQTHNNKLSEQFEEWYGQQSFTSLKNWIRKQIKKGIDCAEWYIKISDTEKIPDYGRIKDIWYAVKSPKHIP